MYEQFTDRARKVMQLANQEAQRFNHEYIGTEHILLGLVKEGSGVAANVLKNLDIDLRKIRLEVEKIVQSGPEMVTMGKLPQTPRAKKIIEYAIEEARTLAHNYVGTEHLLLGLLREEEGVAAQVLMTLGLKPEDIREEVLNLNRHSIPEEKEAKTPALGKFGRDLTELARQGKLDPAIGRANEIASVVQVLSRQSRNNPMLLAEARVPVLPIVEGVAQLIVAGSVPEPLRGRRLLALDLVEVVACARRMENDFWIPIRAIVNEARRSKPEVILFLEGFHSWVRWEAFSFTLSQALRREAIQCLATTTPARWAELLKTEPNLEDYFRPVAAPPPSPEVCVKLLRQVRDRYESHFRARITEEALHAAVDLAGRHLAGCLPGTALDVLDEACSRACMKILSPSPDLKDIDTLIEQLNHEKELALAEQDFEKAADFRDQADKLKQKKAQVRNELRDRAREVEPVVDERDIAETVNSMADTVVISAK